MRVECEVLVIGAGPAGVSAGLAAARAGADVVVVDRASFPRDKTCGDAVAADAVELLRSLGVDLMDVPRARVSTGVAILPNGLQLPRPHAQPGLIVPRLELDAALARALSPAGCRLIEGVHIDRLLPHAREPSANGRRIGGEEFSARARVVIAADGPGSIAWSALRLRKPKPRELALAITAYVDGVNVGEQSEHYFEHWLPRGYGWIFPSVQGLANVGVYQRADRYHARGVPLRDLLARFVDSHPERFSEARIQRVRTWPLPISTWRTLAKLPCGAGVLCAGDAARVVDPLSGEGIWQALATGVLAGEAAALAVRRGGLPRGAARWVAHRQARKLLASAALHGAAQGLMELLVATGAADRPAVTELLRWGYARQKRRVIRPH